MKRGKVNKRPEFRAKMKLITYVHISAGCFLMVILSCLHVLNAQSVYCTPKVFAEINERFTLSCRINGSIHELYWYPGRDKNSLPLLQFRGGEFSGQAFGGGEYELSRNGSLTILRTALRHEGLYRLRVYFNGRDFRDSESTVTVYIPPDIKFPSIDACQSANGDCEQMVTGSGELVCQISNSRPMIHLEWIVVNQTNTNFVKQGFTSEDDEISKTSTSTVGIQYITKGCGSEAVLQCNAIDVTPIGILDTLSSTVTIRTEKCQVSTTSVTPVSPERHTARIWPVVVVLVLLITSAFFIFFCRRKLKVRSSSPLERNNYVPSISHPGSLPVKDKKKLLIESLKEHYKKYCFVKPLPWDEPIPIDILYTPSRCTIEEWRQSEKQTGISQMYSSDDLYQTQFRKNNGRVLITGDLGYGKTTFTQHFINEWIKDQSDDFILIFVQLREVTTSTTLSSFVRDMIPQEGRLTADDIDHIIQNNECMMLLDGLDEISFAVSHCESWVVVGDGDKNHNDEDGWMMTVGDLLQNSIDMKYKNVIVWITSREVNDMHSLFRLPYAKVKLTGFNESDVDKYVEKTCNYTTVKSKGVDINEYQNRVKQGIEENDIYRDFAKTPLLLIMIVHIIAYKISNFNERMKEVNVTQLTTIVQMIITCLESRYFQKINKEVEDKTIRDEIKSLELKLGRLVAEEGFGCMASGRDEWGKRLKENELSLALSIGLLKLTKDVRAGNDGIEELAFTSQPTIDFYHEYFQEFLTAKYITESNYNMGKLNVLVKRLDEDKSVKFLQFIFGLANDKKLEESCSALDLRKANNKWNNLIDCLYEVNDNDKKAKTVKNMSKGWILKNPPVVVVKFLERKSHRLALTSFCELCHSENIPLKSLIFTEGISVSILPNLRLPAIKHLEFTDMTIDLTDCKSIITCLEGQKELKDVSFKNCNLSDDLRNIDKAVEQELGVKKTKSSGDLHVFEPINGVWTQPTVAGQ